MPAHRAKSPYATLFNQLSLAVLTFALAALPVSATTAGTAGEPLAGSAPARALPKVEAQSLTTIPLSLAAVLPADDPAATQTTPHNEDALLPRNASTGLSLVGTVTFSTAGGALRITVGSITNTRSSGTSGTLRVALWATSTVPVFGNPISAYTLGSFTLNPLAAGSQYSNVDQTVTLTNPPPGCYYLTLALQEFQSSGFSYVDLRTFTSGGTPDGSGYDRFAFGGATCASPSSCVQDSSTACLLNGRFKATVRYRNVFDDQPANAIALRKPVTGFASPNFETVFFYFNSSDNIEMLLKMLDQGNTDSLGQPTIAVLFGTATPLRVELTITDTDTGTVRTYVSPFNSQRGSTDFTAFVK
jgi:hypothetical protein